MYNRINLASQIHIQFIPTLCILRIPQLCPKLFLTQRQTFCKRFDRCFNYHVTLQDKKTLPNLQPYTVCSRAQSNVNYVKSMASLFLSFDRPRLPLILYSYVIQRTIGYQSVLAQYLEILIFKH